jgi:DNA-binding NtrC family response regulator
MDLSDAIRENARVRPRAPVAAAAMQPKPSSSKNSLKERVTDLEIEMIREAMATAGGDKRRIAQMLGLSPQGLLNKLKRYRLQGTAD